MGIELYKHNKVAYEKILKHFEKSNRTCAIHPTGSGKSFLSMKFLYDNRYKKLLFMAPTEAIVDQIIRHLLNEGLTKADFPNLDFCLYASAGKIKDKQYDCIVFDEFHRIGAEEWGKNIDELLNNNPDAKILGVSATPIRYLDDGRDMSKEIFKGDIASEITLAEAIVKKILPTPNYISSVISFQSDLDIIQKQINNYKNKEDAKKYQELLEKAKKMIENAEGLDDVFNNNITNKNGKFIVFCRNYEHMKEMENKCREWFAKVNPFIEISEVHSKQGNGLNKAIVNQFERSKNNSLKLLFSIEMLNEGLHVNDIDGVVMFRPTESPIIYLQQLGRALSVGHNENPIVFDIVNNYGSLDSIIDLKNQVKDIIDEIIIEREDGIDNSDYPSNEELLQILEKFTILEENKNIVDLLSGLKVDTQFTWEDWYNLAKAYYEHHGNLLVPYGYKTSTGYEEDPNGAKLGIWISTQRQAYKGNGKNKITQEQIHKLEEIGMQWVVKETTWEDNYNLAKAYYEHYGNLFVPAKYKTINGYEEDQNGVRLGAWIIKQRQAYKGNVKNKITQEQIHKLEEIGMQWVVKEITWDDWYNLAKAYYGHHGNLLIPYNYKTSNGYEEDQNGVNLGPWISNQRQAYKGNGTNKITQEQIHKLEEIGMQWVVKEITWDDWYNLAKAYYEHYGNLFVPAKYKTINGYEEDQNGVRLGAWIIKQRQAYKGNNDYKITQEQIHKLEEIGMRWGVNETWEDNYNLAKVYYEHHGNLLIPNNYKTSNGYEEDQNGVKLGIWISTQRQAYKGSRIINPEQIKKLEEIGMQWLTDSADDKFQREEITDKNKVVKSREINNRFNTLLNGYEGDSLPSKEQMNEDFINQLNRRR